MLRKRCLLTLSATALGCALSGANVSADLVFFENHVGDNELTTLGNWYNATTDTIGVPPGGTDLAVIDGARFASGPRSVTIDNDYSVDALRTMNGAIVNHVSGTLTALAGGDGTWLGEFKNDPTAGDMEYNLSGGAIVIQDNNDDAFQIGRAPTATIAFNMTGGTIDNAGVTHVGLDGTTIFNHSSGTHSAWYVHIGRFGPSSGTLNLSGDAKLEVDELLIMSDGGGVSKLSIEGSNVDIDAKGLVFRDNATVEFIADENGVSAVDLSSDIRDFWSGDMTVAASLVIDLSAYTGSLSDDILLFDSNGLSNGSMFDGLAEGAVVAGTGGRTITYVGGADGFDVVLKGVIPEPASLVLLGLGSLAVFARRQS
ncbi:PEP-CTERM sorting domain-containing protein [Poriferisphaera sp. WC338]|uniref:PEP-CTERM sorting domain-containing protein n=1 Tax=Poriferisphaera sp. WC338 TaxID=3425129 RepID=UPI003D81ACFB